MIKDSSYDVIAMPAGLHHIPPERLPAFLKEVKRILKPWGMFLVRDHDLQPDNKLSVYLAHTVFNMISSSESIEAELTEQRYLKPLQH